MSELDLHLASVKSFNQQSWRDTLPILFPTLFTHEFCDPHKRFWEWADAISPGESAHPFFGIWSRNLGKSTNVESMVVYLMLLCRRHYCWYVSETQASADSHVASISSVMAEPRILNLFPLLHGIKSDKVGEHNVWRRNKITSHPANISIEAVGLNSTVRGRREGDKRPDLIVFDDIDGRHDSLEMTHKKIEMMSQTIIPSGSTDVIYIGIQNLLSLTGVFSRIVEGDLGLTDAFVDGPIPAILNLEMDGSKIIGGTPVWPQRLSIAFCQNFINTTPNGLDAFMREFQHEVKNTEGALWSRDTIRHTNSAPETFDYCVVGIDPSGKDKTSSDETGIIVAGIKDDTGYILDDLSGRWSAEVWAEKACSAARQWGASLLVETNQGGMYLSSVLKNHDPTVLIRTVHATINKEMRARPVSQLYEQGRIFHVGVFPELEEQMISWTGEGKSPDRIDALSWALWQMAQTIGGQTYSLVDHMEAVDSPEQAQQVSSGLASLM